MVPRFGLLKICVGWDYRPKYIGGRECRVYSGNDRFAYLCTMIRLGNEKAEKSEIRVVFFDIVDELFYIDETLCAEFTA